MPTELTESPAVIDQHLHVFTKTLDLYDVEFHFPKAAALPHAPVADIDQRPTRGFHVDAATERNKLPERKRPGYVSGSHRKFILHRF
jgi:hypothetical protein